MELMEMLDRERSEIVAEALASMQRAGLTHYQAAGPEASRARLDKLFEVVNASLAGRTLMPIEQHAEAVATERFRSGFGLGEVQTAFNVLEEAMWKHIESSLPPADLGRALALVSSVLGSGKDHLARTYVSLATQTHVPALDLKALFRAPQRP
jgi:hypothetical protein